MVQYTGKSQLKWDTSDVQPCLPKPSNDQKCQTQGSHIGFGLTTCYVTRTMQKTDTGEQMPMPNKHIHCIIQCFPPKPILKKKRKKYQKRYNLGTAVFGNL